MRSAKVVFTLALIIASATLVLGWDYHPTGGGNTEKIIIVDDDTYECYGAWFFNNDDNFLNSPWNISAAPVRSKGRSSNICFTLSDAGDAVEILDTLYALEISNKGIIYCRYDNAAGKRIKHFSRTLNSGYYEYNDVQLLTDDSGIRDFSVYLAAVKAKEFAGNIILAGLYQTNALTSSPRNEDLIASTANKNYEKIFRDLNDEQVYYTWYSQEGVFGGFQKITTAGNFPSLNFYFDNDFSIENYCIREITGFYHYKDHREIVHQYLFTKSIEGTNDTWYRDNNKDGSLSSEEWEKLQVNTISSWKSSQY